MLRTTILLLWGLLLLPGTPATAQDATAEPGTYTNPVFDVDFPDPDVLFVEGVYYAYATNTASFNIQVARSHDLVHWEHLGDALPRLPAWARQEFGWAWAPEVMATEEGYRMYFVARNAIGGAGPQCIGVASSESPEGPFEPDDDAPFICQLSAGGSIDPATFIDTDGTSYLLWKNDGNAVGGQSWIYIQQLSPDGTRLEGEATRLITADQPWEGILVEGPTLWERDGSYYLFYSANVYDSRNYAVGYAVATDIFGPYEKPQARPILETSIREGIIGPGGQDIVLDAGGQTWMLFHNWRPGGYRSMSLVRLEWADGEPVVQPTRAPLPAPEPQDS